MAQDTRGWIVQPNPDREVQRETTDADGNTTTVTEFGGLEWAYRRPGDHVLVYSGVAAEDDPPDQSAAEHLAASGWVAPVPDSVAAADALAAQQQQPAGDPDNPDNPPSPPAQ